MGNRLKHPQSRYKDMIEPRGGGRPPREPDEGDLVRQAKLVVRSSCRAYEPEILGAQPGLLGDELA